MLFVGPKEYIAVVKLKKEEECKESSIENNIKFNVKHVRIIKFQTTQTLKLMWVSSYCFLLLGKWEERDMQIWSLSFDTSFRYWNLKWESVKLSKIYWFVSIKIKRPKWLLLFFQTQIIFANQTSKVHWKSFHFGYSLSKKTFLNKISLSRIQRKNINIFKWKE